MTVDADVGAFSGVVESQPRPAIIRPAERPRDQCPPNPKPVTTEVLFDNRPVVFSSAKSSAQLGQMKTSTVFSHGPNEVFVTGGITSSNISSQVELATATLTWKGEDLACLYPAGVKVTVTYAPEVYIASGYAPSSCRYQSTMQHELRHVNTDIITLKEFIPWVEERMKAQIAAIPLPRPQGAAARSGAEQQMMAGIQAALADAMNTMNSARMARQQMIDTRQEYLRMSKACPQEKL
ncbi:MAG: hypothetical protein AB7H77_12455 [Bdellovibrionales bacterium]